jgi:hypothetical protein
MLGLDFIETFAASISLLIGVSPTHQCVAQVHSFAETSRRADILKPLVTRLLETCEQFDSVWYLSFFTLFADADLRQLFWPFDNIMAVCPPGPRPLSLAIDVLLDVARVVPRLDALAENSVAPLFTDAALEREEVRECAVRALAATLGRSFNPTRRGKSEDLTRILAKFLTGKSDVFFAR